MTDREKWDFGVVAVQREFESFPLALKSRVDRCASAIKSLKKDLHQIAREVGGDDICAKCNGECCKSGKSHVRGVDLVVYLVDARELFTPRFERDICPYLGESGCLMGAEYRPYNCITFICERVEDLLAPSEKERITSMEQELRTLYRELDRFFDDSFRHSLLSIFDRQQQRKLKQLDLSRKFKEIDRWLE